MAGLEKKQNPTDLASLLQGGSQLLSLFASKKSSTGGQTETTATNMSKEGLDAILRQILEGNQGLAAVSRGQRQAGLYNSSANTLLTNDLITRASGEVAKINAPTTRTTSGQISKVEAPLSASKGLGALATGTLINNILKSDTAKKAGTSVIDAITGAIGGGKRGDSGWSSGFDLPMGDVGGGTDWTSGFDLSGLSMDAASSGWTGGFDIGGGGSFMGTGSGSSGVSEAKAIYDIFTSDDPGASTEKAIGQAVGGYFGGPVGAAIGGAVAEPVFEAGYDVLGATEDAFYDVINPIEGVFKDIGKSVGCFITTATVKLMGKTDDCDELQTLRAFRDGWLKDNYPEAIQEYYDVAPKILDALSAMPNAEELLKEIYSSYILPSVEAVKQGENGIAYEIYTRMVMMLSKTTGLVPTKEVT